MKKSKIRNALSDYTNEVYGNSSRISNKFDKDDIHAFRLSLKKLRAFIRLLNTAGQTPRAKITHKVKRLYQSAGAIRDAQLELSDIKDQNVPLPEYRQKLKWIIRMQKKEWNRHYNRKVFKKLRKTLRNSNFAPLDVGQLKTFFKVKMDEMLALANEANPTDDQIHRIRKDAKDILYAAHMAAQYSHKAKALKNSFPLDQLQLISDKIGQYHDQVVRLQHLALYSSPDMAAEEQETLDLLCEQKRASLPHPRQNILDATKRLNIATAPTVPTLY